MPALATCKTQKRLTDLRTAGYISMMIPSNMMLSLLRPNLYLPTVVIVWGVVRIACWLASPQNIAYD